MFLQTKRTLSTNIIVNANLQYYDFKYDIHLFSNIKKHCKNTSRLVCSLIKILFFNGEVFFLGWFVHCALTLGWDIAFQFNLCIYTIFILR